ncbi:baseplate J/gp47 family protein [Pseudactinotalea sp. Z1748]|uniref:baseplate J/gp47 family protein n=1 Tax=Pseudactinotalea sp. Z1748 TaxID=3413027 RepID=UPI003C7ADDB4
MTGPLADSGQGPDLDSRRALVRAATPPRNGIDIVEVLSNHRGTAGHVPLAPQQRTLLVHLLRGPVPADLGPDRIRVLGGVRPDPRLNPVRVTWAYPALDVAGGPGTSPVTGLKGVSAADRTLVSQALPAERRDGVLVVRTSSSGDWSTYVLALLGPGGQGYPPGFDELLSREPFTFTVDCPDPLDCGCRSECPPPPGITPVLDYLARDYPALRTRLLDRFAELVPNWRDTSAADPAVTLLELFAYLGDRLTLWQDAVAGEAYLPTARRRPSVRRHARLLDYRVHEGCAARTWLTFEAPIGGAMMLGSRTPVAALPAGTGEVSVVDALHAGDAVFETMHAAHLSPARNALALHSWGEVDACLPAGTTTAFLAHPPGADPALAAGDVLVLTPVDEDETTVTGEQARRQAVRLVTDPLVREDPYATAADGGPAEVLEIRWGSADALRYPLPISRRRSDGTAGVAARALANVVLAEHAATLPSTALDPSQVPQGRRYEPHLDATGVAWADEQVDPASAASALRVDPRRARAQILLDDGARTWRSASDLLSSSRLDAAFVAEPEESRQVQLRFGDGISGRSPAAGDTFVAYVRVGGGAAGNVGPDVLTTILSTATTPAPGGVQVSNPLPAAGGQEPEPLQAVAELAPYAFRSQLRAVTSADHAAAANRVSGVQDAIARRRWAGSWYSHEVTLDVTGAHAGDDTVTREVHALLEARRMTGVDVALTPPVFVPLEIVVGVRVADGHLRADVRAALLRVMSARTLTGSRGFFHPDNFTFGQSLFVSDLVAAIMTVPGVTWVDVEDSEHTGLRFRRMGRPGAHDVQRGRIQAQPREMLRAESDPSLPENGRFDVVLRGGT